MEVDRDYCCSWPLCEPAALLCIGGNGGEARGSSSLPNGSARLSAVDQNDESEAYLYNIADRCGLQRGNGLFALSAEWLNHTTLVRPIRQEENCMTISPEQHGQADIVSVAADIVAAYVSNNPLPVGELPKLISDIHAALRGIGTPVTEPVVKQEPAVSIRKSVTADYIICLEDGKKFKSLKRHLATHYDLSPDDYRQKWSLPSDYPMVAPSYAAARSALAKSIGLGRKAAAPTPAAAGKPKRATRAAAAVTTPAAVKSPVKKARKAATKA